MKFQLLLLLFVGLTLSLFATEEKESVPSGAWEKNGVFVIATLNKKEYTESESIDLKIMIVNTSQSDSFIILTNPYRDFDYYAMDLGVKQPLPMTERYKKVKEDMLYFRRVKKTIPPGELFIAGKVNVKDFFIFNGKGEYSLSISGKLYFGDIKNVEDYSIENLTFGIK